nr:hypothetical protein 29 [bacterium]
MSDTNTNTTTNTDEEPTVEISEKALADYVIRMAREMAEWETYLPDNLANEDSVWDEVRLSNVTHVDVYGDADEVEVGGKFETRVVEDYIRATWWDPPVVHTSRRDTFFTIRFTFEDLGHATGTIEVV